MNELSDQSEQQTSGSEEPGRELSISRSAPAEGGVPSGGTASDPPGVARVVSQGPAGQGKPRRLLFTPTIDIYNTEDGLVLRADLPGVCVERLELQIEDNKLTLFGRVQENLPQEARLLHAEYQVGDFYRSFILSDEVAYDKITAKMTSGVLEIRLPQIPRAQPRKIPVHSD